MLICDCEPTCGPDAVTPGGTFKTGSVAWSLPSLIARSLNRKRSPTATRRGLTSLLSLLATVISRVFVRVLVVLVLLILVVLLVLVVFAAVGLLSAVRGTAVGLTGVGRGIGTGVLLLVLDARERDRAVEGGVATNAVAAAVDRQPGDELERSVVALHCRLVV